MKGFGTFGTQFINANICSYMWTMQTLSFEHRTCTNKVCKITLCAMYVFMYDVELYAGYVGIVWLETVGPAGILNELLHKIRFT